MVKIEDPVKTCSLTKHVASPQGFKVKEKVRLMFTEDKFSRSEESLKI